MKSRRLVNSCFVKMADFVARLIEISHSSADAASWASFYLAIVLQRDCDLNQLSCKQTQDLLPDQTFDLVDSYRTFGHSELRAHFVRKYEHT
jgi:hypothetical protein